MFPSEFGLCSVSLVGPLVIVPVHEIIQILLQRFQIPVQFFPECNPVKFIQHRLVKSFANTICLGAFHLGFCVFDIIKLEIQFIRMFIR